MVASVCVTQQLSQRWAHGVASPEHLWIQFPALTWICAYRFRLSALQILCIWRKINGKIVLNDRMELRCWVVGLHLSLSLSLSAPLDHESKVYANLARFNIFAYFCLVFVAAGSAGYWLLESCSTKCMYIKSGARRSRRNLVNVWMLMSDEWRIFALG